MHEPQEVTYRLRMNQCTWSGNGIGRKKAEQSIFVDHSCGGMLTMHEPVKSNLPAENK